MRTKNSNRTLYRIKYELGSFLSQYKKFLWLVFFIALFGVIVGILTASKSSEDIKITSLLDKPFYEFLLHNKSWVGLFFSYFFKFLLMSAIIILCSYSPWLLVINSLVLLFYTYCIGFNTACLIILFPFAGIINCILILIPFGITTTFLLMLLCSISMKTSFLRRKYGVPCNKRGQVVNFFKIYAIIIGFSAILLFLQCLILPVSQATIIVS